MPEKPPAPKSKSSQPAEIHKFDTLVPIRSAMDLLRDDVTDEVRSLARTDPETVAKLLRDWIARR